MKQIVTVVVAIFMFGLATNAQVEFKEMKFSFGKIKQGVPKSHVFTFKNTSDKPLVIESAVAGCGCTTPEYPKAPIAKGKTASIKVTYNAANPGTFTKDVTVKFVSVQQPTVLTIEGEVVTGEAKAGEDKKTATPAPKPLKKALTPAKS
jgi:hypothetical protein